MNGHVMKIVVSAISKFGVLDKVTERWFNPSDSKLLAEFKVDGEYEVEMVENKGKDGKTYTNIVKIVSRTENSKPATKSSFKPFNKGGYKTEATAVPNKDERILIQGLTQALLQSPVMSLVDHKEVLPFVETNVVALAAMVKRLAK